jgi:hypothetical protein
VESVDVFVVEVVSVFVVVVVVSVFVVVDVVSVFDGRPFFGIGTFGMRSGGGALGGGAVDGAKVAVVTVVAEGDGFAAGFVPIVSMAAGGGMVVVVGATVATVADVSVVSVMTVLFVVSCCLQAARRMRKTIDFFMSTPLRSIGR